MTILACLLSVRVSWTNMLGRPSQALPRVLECALDTQKPSDIQWLTSAK
jgi:hypothetical protein